MTCEFVKFEQGQNLTIWIDIDQPFTDEEFFSEIERECGVKHLSTKQVFFCSGPAQKIEEISTNRGTFKLSKQFEDFESGIDIYSEDKNIMHAIYNALSSSCKFRERIVDAPGIQDVSTNRT